MKRSYRATVEAVQPTGELAVTLWEQPDSTESLAVLTVAEHHLDTSAIEGEPRPGDTLDVWTGCDPPDPPVHGRFRARPVATAEERAEARRLLESLR
jgi:hypothetical protein